MEEPAQPDLGDARDSLRQAIDLLRQIAAALSAGERVQAEALDAAGVAQFLSCSRALIFSLDSKGLIPAPIELSEGGAERRGCPRWRRDELRAWLRAGAPPRQRWATMRESALRRIA